jgi:hypothetical protein
MKTFLNIAAITTAVGLVAFSGTISAYGLSKFCPGAELAIIVMAVLFECAKLTGFAMVHRPAPRALKVGLLSAGLLLMLLNIVGVAGFLSNAYTRSQIDSRSMSHTATATAHAEASLLERQLAQAEQVVSEARRSVLRARDDKGRVRAAQAALSASTAERDAILAKLSAANIATAKVEGAQIQAGGEFAAVVFLAQMFGTDQDVVARILIAVIAALPDILAALLIITIGYVAPKPKATPSPRKKIVRRRRVRSTPKLKVITSAP